MSDTKEFTLGEVATIITGRCYSRKDPCAKSLIEWISGEPASEFTWMMAHPNRIDFCRDWLLKSANIPEFDADTEAGRQALEITKVKVLSHPSFPEPERELQ